MAHERSRQIVLIAPQRSPTAALGGGVAGVVIGLTTALLAADDALPPWVRAVTAAVGGLLAAALFVTAKRLGRPRGGLLVEPAGRGIGIGLTDADDIYWIPLASVAGVGVRHRDVVRDGSPQRYWSAEILCTDRPSVVLAEASEREAVERVVEMLVGDGDLQRAPEPAPTDHSPPRDDEEPVDASTVTGVRRGAALNDVLFMFGASLTTIGAALFAQLTHQPMVAIFIAPVLFLLGAVMLGVVLAKRYAGEQVEVRNNILYHRWLLGRWSWGESEADARRVRWRLRVQALKGAYLEAVASDGIITIAAGATTRSHVSVEGLNRVPGALSMSPSDLAPRTTSD